MKIVIESGGEFSISIFTFCDSQLRGTSRRLLLATRFAILFLLFQREELYHRGEFRKI
jgi:hypothetical protein